MTKYILFILPWWSIHINSLRDNTSLKLRFQQCQIINPQLNITPNCDPGSSSITIEYFDTENSLGDLHLNLDKSEMTQEISH